MSEAGVSESSLFGGSEPDVAAPQVTTAAEHAQENPFFAGARGRKRTQKPRPTGTGGAGGAGPSADAAPNNTSLIVPDDADRPQFCPISLRELEYKTRADGGESSVWSDEEDDEEVATQKKKKKKRSRNGKAPMTGDDESVLAAATFGGGGEDSEDSDDDEDVCEEASEAPESSVGGRLLPIRGESCVGCVCDRSVVSIIDKFVRENATSMTEDSLYKSAALHYKREVVEPRKREGVKCLSWKWKEIKSHYALHVCDPLLQRAAAVRSLGAVRAVQEQALMRVNSDGSKQLDAKGAELLLKIITLQDKQLSALDAVRMPPPPARGRG